MLPLFKKADKIQKFWKWFDLNKEKFEDMDEERDEKLDQMLGQLHKIKAGLSVEISNNKQGTREITISAEGDIDKFPIVKEIVAGAPVIQGWVAIAFRQPTPVDFTLEIADLRLTPSELYFVPLIEKDALDILIIGEGFNAYDFEMLGHYGLIMLDNLMGEYNSVTKVRHYDFLDLDEVEDTSELRPLLQINSFLEQFYLNQN
jgi:hypothetical protein